MKKDADRSKAVVSNDVQQEVPVFDHFLFIFLKILILLNLLCPYLKGFFFLTPVEIYLIADTLKSFCFVFCIWLFIKIDVKKEISFQ